MEISFNCPTCAKSFRVTSDKAGKRAKCSACGEHLRVPGAVTEKAKNGPPSSDRSGPDGCQQRAREPVPLKWKQLAAPGGVLLASLVMLVLLNIIGERSRPSASSTPPASYTPAPQPDPREVEKPLREKQEREAARREQLILAIARRYAKNEDDRLQNLYEIDKGLHELHELNRKAAADLDGRLYFPRPFRPYVSQLDALHEKYLRETRRDCGDMSLKRLEEFAKVIGAI